MGSQNARQTNNQAVSAATGGFPAIGNVKEGTTSVKVPQPTKAPEEEQPVKQQTREELEATVAELQRQVDEAEEQRQKEEAEAAAAAKAEEEARLQAEAEAKEKLAMENQERGFAKAGPNLREVSPTDSPSKEDQEKAIAQNTLPSGDESSDAAEDGTSTTEEEGVDS